MVVYTVSEVTFHCISIQGAPLDFSSGGRNSSWSSRLPKGTTSKSIPLVVRAGSKSFAQRIGVRRADVVYLLSWLDVIVGYSILIFHIIIIDLWYLLSFWRWVGTDGCKPEMPAISIITLARMSTGSQSHSISKSGILPIPNALLIYHRKHLVFVSDPLLLIANDLPDSKYCRFCMH